MTPRARARGASGEGCRGGALGCPSDRLTFANLERRSAAGLGWVGVVLHLVWAREQVANRYLKILALVATSPIPPEQHQLLGVTRGLSAPHPLASSSLAQSTSWNSGRCRCPWA